MAVPTEMQMPTYIIYRDTQPGQPTNFAAPLVFLPPQGSDELFDALRAKYPHLKTHSERVREATLEFFTEEDLIQQTQFPTPQTAAASTNVSPWEASMPSFCSEASTWSSPEALGPATPSSSPQGYPLSRQPSAATSFVTATDSSPQALEAMTSVFSLANTVQPKQRVRRKMTESEKVEYRKRRQAKACDKCAKRKRKCSHNQEEMEIVASKTKAVSKPKTLSTSKRSHSPKLPKIQESDCHPDNFPYAGNMDLEISPDSGSISTFDDFTSGFLEFQPHLDFDVDDFLPPTQPQWPWSDTADWTLLDPFDPTPDAMNATFDSGLLQQQMSSHQFALFDDSEPMYDWAPSMNSSTTRDNNSPRAGGHATQQHQQQQGVPRPAQPARPIEVPDPHGFYVDPSCLLGGGMQQDSSACSGGRSLGGSSGGTSGGTLGGTAAHFSQQDGGERMVGGTRKAGGAIVSVGERSTNNEGMTGGETMNDGQRLSGNERNAGGLGRPENAKQTFAKTAADGRTSQRSPSLSGVKRNAHEANAELSQTSARGGRGSEDGLSSDQQLVSLRQGQTYALARHKTAARGQTGHGPDDQSRTNGQFQRLTNRSGDEDHRQLHDSRLEQEDAHKNKGPVSRNIGLGMNKAPGSSKGMLQKRGCHQKKQAVSFGGGATSSVSPSTQLFMLKRRIPETGRRLAVNGEIDRTFSMIARSQVSEHSSTSGPMLRLQTIPRAQTPNEITCESFGSAFLPNSSAAGAPTLLRGEAKPLIYAVSLAESPLDISTFSDDLAPSSRLSIFGVNEERLSDHVRRRDHFGRSTGLVLDVLRVLAGLGCLLVLLACLPLPRQSLSLLLLALATPVGHNAGTSSSQASRDFGVSRALEDLGTYFSSRFDNLARSENIPRQMKLVFRSPRTPSAGHAGVGHS